MLNKPFGLNPLLPTLKNPFGLMTMSMPPRLPRVAQKVLSFLSVSALSWRGVTLNMELNQAGCRLYVGHVESLRQFTNLQQEHGRYQETPLPPEQFQQVPREEVRRNIFLSYSKQRRQFYVLRCIYCFLFSTYLVPDRLYYYWVRMPIIYPSFPKPTTVELSEKTLIN